MGAFHSSFLWIFALYRLVFFFSSSSSSSSSSPFSSLGVLVGPGPIFVFLFPIPVIRRVNIYTVFYGQ